MLTNRRLWALTRPHHALRNTLTLVVCAGTATYWAQAWFLAAALSGLLPGQPQNVGRVMLSLAAVLACGLARTLLTQVQVRVASTLGGRVREDVRRSLTRALLHPRRLRDASERAGTRRLALGEGTDGVEPYVIAYIPAALQLQILCPILLIVIAIINPLLAAALAAALLIAVGAPRLWSRLLTRRGSAHWDTYEALSADFAEGLQGMRTLKILDAVPRFRVRLNDRSDALHRATVRTMRVSLADTALADLGIQAGLLAAAALTTLSALGVLPSGLLGGTPALSLFTLMLASELFRPVRDLARHWHAGYLGMSALGSIDAAIGDTDTPAESAASDTRPGAPDGGTHRDREERRKGEPHQPDEQSRDHEPHPSRGGVLRLDRLGFAYAPDSPPVLNEVTTTITRGGITALAGPSGTGKSTLFDVLLGFLPASGECRLDGRPLRPEDISVVSQHAYLFPGTIRANLSAVAPDASDADMLAVMHRAGLGRELTSWPLGLDTRVSESGRSLSGGQIQRLSVARGLLANRAILLLDEPTSALNPELAAHLLATLREEARSRIVIMIAHRAEALAAADTVLTLRAGTLHRASTPAAAPTSTSTPTSTPIPTVTETR
ncbi:ABC-type transport system involved in cytochrome bd biosynthesis fused ATPase/permease subunit [Mycetocola sp. BIGb0189]|uniref:ATP-binding cassette domain-containing protein n=1 Tax=Mycetocola sp. BIGb0189 TaxID=2940604 RepID=UPI00216A5B10|nr:ATP-binding cassette domain-containing protein [Mycetocola sp. BIGb0189]MCS4275906.1 ABC-type transport system involved in cytochrome bd biosynthesis fused ATPase/permease subunit [Mycetocola sp. BIGb0189]